MEVFRAKSGINLHIGLQGNIKILYSNNVFEKYHISLTVIREKCVVTKKEIEPSEEDVKAIANELLVAHHTADNMPKQTRKKLRVRGKVKLNSAGQPIYMQGDTARALLHKDTFYGAIKRDDEIRYVVRKSLEQLQVTDIEKIVDEAVKALVKEAIATVGFKTAMNPAEYTIWMNREKGIPIRKVRIFTPNVTQPILLKKQRDLSDKEYKQDYHVVNDGNYCMAIYEGQDKKGKTKRTF